jgi:type I restriction enzyme M protein
LKNAPGVKTIKELNAIETKRGKSPPVAEYVSAREGYALVVKSGSNISKTGELIVDGDYIEQSTYQEYVEKKLILQDGDILLASTGDGTLGKCCVYRNKDEHDETRPGIPEGHVTVIRVDPSEVYPEYLCDYLRKGFGHDQLYRIFTGSTGMVEVAPDEVNEVLVSTLPPTKEQKRASKQLRKSEKRAAEIAEQSVSVLVNGGKEFHQLTLP